MWGTWAEAELGGEFDLYASRLIEDGMVCIALFPVDVARRFASTRCGSPSLLGGGHGK